VKLKLELDEAQQHGLQSCGPSSRRGTVFGLVGSSFPSAFGEALLAGIRIQSSAHESCRHSAVCRSQLRCAQTVTRRAVTLRAIVPYLPLPPCPLHSSPIARTKRTTTMTNHSGLRIPTLPSSFNIYEQMTGDTANTDTPVVSRSAQERPGSLTSTFTRSPLSPSVAPMTPATTHTTNPPRIYPGSTLEFRLSVTAALEVRHPSSQPVDTAQLLKQWEGRMEHVDVLADILADFPCGETSEGKKEEE
jgi:hypothetical protein